MANTGYNLGLQFVQMQNKAFDLTETRIHTLVDQLTHLNAINKDLSDLMNRLTGCKEKEVADFSEDAEMKAIIDRIYALNPKIFHGDTEPRYVWNTEKQIDMTLSALDAEVKTQITAVNQTTLFINKHFDERVQYTESARKTMDLLIRHVDSIISKYNKQ